MIMYLKSNHSFSAHYLVTSGSPQMDSFDSLVWLYGDRLDGPDAF